jgi:hypothetical protein
MLAISIVGCTSTSESIAPINTSDLNEADFVRSVLSTNPDAKGNYEVVPGHSVTTVRISRPNRPENEAALRESMRSIKNAIREKLHSDPNNLRFIFREVTIEE